ncbi:hypothetical protein SAMN04488503_3163 [Humidesulfovibrio mexicanus]|uniref:O-antigen ligase like membrane protein n=1 Tax=Humidesulfovibrio mexicanus TaxID=147047 RepID=A0A239CJE2_9BACT|nr:hypothetical protein [Humidesulfovibrio mexicanus]SNS20230.1 hypothetical protein SAMN04488503_3163 [Humidesulfovibrio mexicanus]
MTLRPAALAAALPLFAAFVAAPLAVLAGKLSGREDVLLHFGPRGLAPWLVLSGGALAYSLVMAARTRKAAQQRLWPVSALGLGLGAAAGLLAALLPPLLEQAVGLAPLLDELRLPALVLFAALWAWSFGTPERGLLARSGAVLGALCVLDFLLTAIMARSLVLGGGFLFGEASGTADILAFLLCIGLAATLDDTVDPRQPRLARWLILAGVLSTFSRPGLCAAGIMCLVLERGPLKNRLAAALACGLAVWVSLSLPLPLFDESGDLGLAWHLTATTEALDQEPWGYLTGMPLDQPLALAVPEFQGLLWEEDFQGLPVYAFDIPSSGLRLLAAWGAAGPLAVLGGAGLCALKGRGRFGLGLLVALFFCAALSPVLHVPATAAAFALALASATRKAPDPAAPEQAA